MFDAPRRIDSISLLRLNECLVLDPVDWVAVRRPNISDDVCQLNPFSQIKDSGYSIDGVGISSHYAVWALYYNAWPPIGFEVDHINRVHSDNAIWNLRLATPEQNFANRQYLPRARSRALTGVVRRGGKYFARFGVGESGPTPFDCAVCAHLEYQVAHSRRHGEFSGWHLWRVSPKDQWIERLARLGRPTPDEIEADIVARYGVQYLGCSSRVSLDDPELLRELGVELQFRKAIADYYDDA